MIQVIIQGYVYPNSLTLFQTTNDIFKLRC